MVGSGTGARPVTLIVPDTRADIVALYAASDRIVLVDADAGKVTRQIELFDEPYGLVSTKDGQRLYATLDYPAQIVEIDPAAGQIVRTIDAGQFLRGIALAGDERRLVVTEFYTGTAIAIDLASGKEVDRWPGVTNDNLCRQIVLHPTRPKAYLPHIRQVARSMVVGSETMNMTSSW